MKVLLTEIRNPINMMRINTLYCCLFISRLLAQWNLFGTQTYQNLYIFLYLCIFSFNFSSCLPLITFFKNDLDGYDSNRRFKCLYLSQSIWEGPSSLTLAGLLRLVLQIYDHMKQKTPLHLVSCQNYLSDLFILLVFMCIPKKLLKIFKPSMWLEKWQDILSLWYAL